MRWCAKCERDLPLGDFYHRDGRAVGWCKPCWRENTRLRRRPDHLMRKYGITVDQFDVMLAAQGGVCRICRSGDPRGVGSFHVDHDHDTGVIRGLLCSDCNLGLGLFKDDATLLLGAANYLQEAPCH